MPTPPPIDVCNGDADGLCALQQLRLAEGDAPGAQLVTGPKRRIGLLAGLEAPPGTRVTVLDVSFRENRADVERLLAGGCTVRYFDHHASGDLPAHPALETHIDTAAGVCTSLLVDRSLGGAQRAWAVTGAFGDNLTDSARAAAKVLALAPPDLEALRELGELLNYNGYGEELADLYFHPADLFRALHPFAEPLDFARTAPEVATLRAGLAADLGRVDAVQAVYEGAAGRVLVLPAEPWAQRVQGVYANRLANGRPQQATAVGVALRDGTVRLSVRAPLDRPRGAEALARQFGGGGRAGAAGVNALPAADLPRFVAAFRTAFSA